MQLINIQFPEHKSRYGEMAMPLYKAAYGLPFPVIVEEVNGCLEEIYWWVLTNGRSIPAHLDLFNPYDFPKVRLGEGPIPHKEEKVSLLERLMSVLVDYGRQIPVEAFGGIIDKHVEVLVSCRDRGLL